MKWWNYRAPSSKLCLTHSVTMETPLCLVAPWLVCWLTCYLQWIIRLSFLTALIALFNIKIADGAAAQYLFLYFDYLARFGLLLPILSRRCLARPNQHSKKNGGVCNEMCIILASGFTGSDHVLWPIRKYIHPLWWLNDCHWQNMVSGCNSLAHQLRTA